jgi:hypothetical protein
MLCGLAHEDSRYLLAIDDGKGGLEVSAGSRELCFPRIVRRCTITTDGSRRPADHTAESGPSKVSGRRQRLAACPRRWALLCGTRTEA